MSGAPEAELTGDVELTIGTESGPDAYIFGRISSVIRDPRGRIIVADVVTQEVRAYSPEGTFLFQIGREGAGPGEYRSPVDLAVRAEDELWVRDGGNARLVVFRLGERLASHIKIVPASPGSAFLPSPIAFHPSGRIIDVRPWAEPAFGIVYELRRILNLLDMEAPSCEQGSERVRKRHRDFVKNVGTPSLSGGGRA